MRVLPSLMNVSIHCHDLLERASAPHASSQFFPHRLLHHSGLRPWLPTLMPPAARTYTRISCDLDIDNVCFLNWVRCPGSATPRIVH